MTGIKRRTHAPKEVDPRVLEPIDPKTGGRKATNPEIIDKIEDIVLRTADSIDDQDIRAASLRDRATVIGILVDKRQILKGEPNSIVSFQQREKLNELMPALLEEAARRGMIDVTPSASHVVIDAD